MKMTREEAIRNFREHWASLAISGSEDKNEFLRRHNYPSMLSDCFLREFTMTDVGCDRCPVEWEKTRRMGITPCAQSFYGDWVYSTTPEERKRLAAIIRDLPEKKEVKAEPKFKVGDKVVPVSKNVWFIGDPEPDCTSWKNGKFQKEFLTIKRLANNDVRTLRGKIDGGQIYLCDGDYYLESDLRPYVEPTPKPKFKPGDRIRIKPMSEIQMIVDAGPVFGGWSHGMTEYTEKVYTVQRFINGMDGVFGYRLREIFYSWDERFLDLVVDEPEVKKEYPKELQVEWVGGQPKLKVGDRVRVKSNGRVGTIKGIQDKWPPYIGVEFDEPIFNGHNFNDHLPKGKDGHCYFYNEGQLELLPINHCPEDKTVTVQTITVEFKGPKTICTIKNQFGTFKGRAKCHPTDQWNEKTGADLALERAVEKFNEYQLNA